MIKQKPFTARRLKELMAHYGVTGAKLSALTGVSPQHVSRWRSGASKVPQYVISIFNPLVSGALPRDYYKS